MEPRDALCAFGDAGVVHQSSPYLMPRTNSSWRARVRGWATSTLALAWRLLRRRLRKQFGAIAITVPVWAVVLVVAGVALLLLGGPSPKHILFNPNRDVDGVMQLTMAKLDRYKARTIPVTDQVIMLHTDQPFLHGCQDPDVDGKRASAALVMLVRLKEIDDVVKSMALLERHFNQWFNYPWVFLNDEEFPQLFKDRVAQYTLSEVEFGVIDPVDWNFPADMDPAWVKESVEMQGDRGIMYGMLELYHKMCRFYLGFFFRHPLVAKRDWYWRVEPDVEFFCDITYDPFVEMELRGKRYGFTVMIKELVDTVPNLFRYTRKFIKSHNIQVKGAWEMFLKRDSIVVGGLLHRYRHVDLEDQLAREVDLDTRLDYLLAKEPLNDGHLDPALLEELVRRTLKIHRVPPQRYEDQEYNMCHFWLNFEIARTDLFNSAEYKQYFDFLEQSGGFVSERWGDAPVHLLAVGMFLELLEIHYFRDIGYRHLTLYHCPANAAGKQLPYHPLPNYYQKDMSRDKYWLRPNTPTRIGVGCRCRCPDGHKEVENLDSGCVARWIRVTSDNYGLVRHNVDAVVAKAQQRVQDELDVNGGRVVLSPDEEELVQKAGGKAGGKVV